MDEVEENNLPSAALLTTELTGCTRGESALKLQAAVLTTIPVRFDLVCKILTSGDN